LIVGLCNVGSVPYTIQPGERIAQLIIMPVLTPRVAVVDHLQATSRGDGGFGSTGK
jgi:dUTP diphosphatase